MAPSLTLGEKLSIIPKLLIPLPAILVYTVLISPFSTALKRKKLYRLVFETALRTLGRASVHQLQWLNGTTLGSYRAWAKQFKVETLIEDVPKSGKKLMWIGNKDAEKVVFYVHGGGFMLPVANFAFTFWLFVQREYAKRTGKEISICVMEYSLYPQTFPTQLTETVHAFSHLLSNTKATPSNIHIAGDSAGGNILLQLISHTLHPVAGVPPSPLTTVCVRGTLLISPWVTLNEETRSYTQNDASDTLQSSTLISWGNHYLEGVKDSQLPYVKHLLTGERWFDGIDKVTERIFVTVGGAECMLDECSEIHQRLCGTMVDGKPVLKLDIEEGGVHEDMIMECGAGGKKLTSVGEKIVEWLREGHGDA
ncbi:hypothetical protein E1B28_003134 [Marasmius oreades]|uniref:Alpha/beta hydrolase fold-3 domain-containing protein n=1 Tax=Marasmius oreades TaxID=181124 RepID=A0A9P7UN40_9AGAR|nr:uncharacterized protein E1B28_003134 [Marasmius oreades]KAG7085579.1 hypothetical protein E1B28_003134 [Marasmius oreades]